MAITGESFKKSLVFYGRKDKKLLTLINAFLNDLFSAATKFQRFYVPTTITNFLLVLIRSSVREKVETWLWLLRRASNKKIVASNLLWRVCYNHFSACKTPRNGKKLFEKFRFCFPGLERMIESSRGSLFARFNSFQFFLFLFFFFDCKKMLMHKNILNISGRRQRRARGGEIRKSKAIIRNLCIN